MDKPKFHHDFANSLGITDVNGIRGYVACLSALLTFLKNETEFDPAKRYVDSVKLLDRIANTNEELIGILDREHEDLKTFLNTERL